MERIICLVIGYAFGLVQTGYIYGRLHGTDIRKFGSGNSGSTNALRVMGKKAGAVVLLGDVAKSVLACLLVRVLFGKSQPDMVPLLVIYAGLGVVLGHNYPFYLKFKGGKGIAATGGFVIALGDWKLLVFALSVFLLTVAVTRFVSLGSLLGVSALFIGWVVFTQLGWIAVASTYLAKTYVLMFLFAALAFFQHRKNIVRLVKGTENKLGAKKS